MRRSFKTAIVAAYALMILVGGAAVTGCNTTEGLGKDVESGGKALKNTASDAKD